MGLCPAECGIDSLIPTPLQCTLTPRLKNLNRFGFYSCGTTIPESAEGIQDLIADNAIVFSQPLANVTLEDPTYQEFVLTSCAPAYRIVAGRNVTAEDRIAVTFPEGSPAVPNEWYDWAFWADKQSKSLTLNLMLQYCDGDTIIARDSSGIPLTVDVRVFVNYEASSTTGGKNMEFKSISLQFNGDPLAVDNPPYFNLANDGTVTLL